MMYLTHGLSHCDAENRETGGCRVAESGVPFLNIDRWRSSSAPGHFHSISYAYMHVCSGNFAAAGQS